MIQFGNPSPEKKTNPWRQKLDQFSQQYQKELAAVAWGLRQEWGETQETLGIDLKPNPHFICCSHQAIAQLNQQVGQKIQEIIGIVENCDPQEEVAILVIGDNQFKLLYFKPEPSPPQCLTESELTLDQLIEFLEEKLKALAL
ncbi:MAG: hypothetical protein AB4058_16635 [Microcystaceae cyanobacterium]